MSIDINHSADPNTLLDSHAERSMGNKPIKFSKTPCHHVDDRNQRGSGTVLMAAMMLIAAMVAFVCACLLAWFGCVHQARSAADMAALAGADAYGIGGDACTAASQTAAKNSAELTACTVDSNGVQFIVRVTVSVRFSPRVPFGPGTYTYKSEAGNV